MQILQGVDVGSGSRARYRQNEIGTTPHERTADLVATHGKPVPHARVQLHGVATLTVIGRHGDDAIGIGDRSPGLARHERLVGETDDELGGVTPEGNQKKSQPKWQRRLSSVTLNRRVTKIQIRKTKDRLLHRAWLDGLE